MGSCFSLFRNSDGQADVVAWLEALGNPEYLDWKRRQSGSATPLSLRHIQRIEQMQQTMPVRVDRHLWLADTRSAKRLGRIKYLEISHVLDVDGNAQNAPSRESIFVNAGVMYKRLNVKDVEGYRILEKHFAEASNFIDSARLAGGECLVFCSTGLDASGVIVAAEIMLHNKTFVLDVVREMRFKRGNACLQDTSFQAQLVALAKEKELLGPEPGHPDSVGSPSIDNRSRPQQMEPLVRADLAATARPSQPTAPYVGESFDTSFRRRMRDRDSFKQKAAVPDEEDWPYLEAMRDTQYLDWRKRIDPDIGSIPDDLQQERIEKEQGNLPVQISSNVFLADTRAAKRVGRLKYMGITHVLNVAGADGAPSSMEAYAEAHLLYRMVDAIDRPRYPVLKRHLREAVEFIRSARASGGRCVVYCNTGYDLSGIIVAADTMLREQMTLLNAVAHCRRRRGNAFLSSQGFQEQLLEFARARDLLGDRPELLELDAGTGMARAVKRAMKKKRKTSVPRQASMRADLVQIRPQRQEWMEPGSASEALFASRERHADSRDQNSTEMSGTASMESLH